MSQLFLLIGWRIRTGRGNLKRSEASLQEKWATPAFGPSHWHSSLLREEAQSLLKVMLIELVIRPTISSFDVPFSSHLQSFPASRSFPVSQFFASVDQNIEDLASSSVLPMNIQDCFPLGLTGLISLLSTGSSRVFSNTTIQKHQFFSTQHLWSSSHICI